MREEDCQYQHYEKLMMPLLLFPHEAPVVVSINVDVTWQAVASIEVDLLM